MSKCVVGASSEGGEEEAGMEEETGGSSPKKGNFYQIYGTVKVQEDFKKPEHVKEIIKVTQLLLLLVVLSKITCLDLVSSHVD